MSIRLPDNEDHAAVVLRGEAPPGGLAPWTDLAGWFARETWRRLRGRSAVRLDLSRGPLADSDILRSLVGAVVAAGAAFALGAWRSRSGDVVGAALGSAFAGIFLWHAARCVTIEIPRRARLRERIARDISRAGRRPARRERYVDAAWGARPDRFSRN